MKAKDLIGKRAIRSKPVNLGSGSKDYSYCGGSNPLRILNVKDGIIVYEYSIGGSLRTSTLDGRWNDDNWLDYDETIKPINYRENN